MENHMGKHRDEVTATAGSEVGTVTVETSWLHFGAVDEVAASGPKVIKGIAVFAHEGKIYAVENRCPHMGFPLHLGTVCDGLLTCHWHHARFDICSGGTLDPWADDVPAHQVQVVDGEVYVNPRPKRAKDKDWHFHRLREGLEQNLSLIIAKAVVSLVAVGVPESEIAKVGIDFGTTHRSGGWGPGLTILTANLNILPKLDAYGRILALFQGLVHVARDCSGMAPRYLLQPLPQTDFGQDRLSDWYRKAVEVRDTEGAERVLLAALDAGTNLDALSDLMVVAATDHFYLNGGHTVDFHNKVFEAAKAVGPSSYAVTLTSLVPGFGNPTRSEELQNWQAPVNLVNPLLQAFEKLPEVRMPGAASVGAAPSDTASSAQLAVSTLAPAGFDAEAFVQTVLGDDPAATTNTITEALHSGVNPAYVSQLVALAAAERIVHFHTQNDFADWIAVLHTFTHAHAIHKRIERSQNPLVLRGVYHTAMRIYLDRFLNVPSAPWPRAEVAAKVGYTTDLDELLNLTDAQQRVKEAANWVKQYLDAGKTIDKLWNTLGYMLLREDAEFHSFQMYEAAVQEYDTWAHTYSPIANRAQETLVIALTRYLAAHAPTARELPNVARIAWRLHRGDRLFEDEGE